MSFINDVASFLGYAVAGREVVPVEGGEAPEGVATSFSARRMAMYIAVSYVSNALSMCEIKTYERGRAVKGELYYALNVSPNPNQCGSALVNSLIEHYFYNGHALLVQPRLLRNDFYVADAFGISEVPLGQNLFTGVTVEGRGLAIDVPASRACYFKLEDQEVKGIVNAMYRDLGSLLAFAMSSYKAANGEKFTLTRPNPPGGSHKDEKRSGEEVNDRYRDFLTRPNGILQLYTGQVLDRVKPVGSGASDDVIALRKDIFDTTAAAFKIPQSMMYGNMTNSADIMNQFITFGVDPLANMMSKEMTRKFYDQPSWDGGRNRIEIDTSRIFHTDMFQVADKVEKLLSTGLYSIDELREPLGADPLGTDFSSAHWMTKNYTTVQDALSTLMDQTDPERG